ncbi:putative transposase [Shigella sonnei 3226-85]|nr:putative transposase [Shigella sonnei 3226-85]
MDARAIWMAVQQPGKEIAVKQKNSSRYWFCTVPACNW